jgi:hypothetical protein
MGRIQTFTNPWAVSRQAGLPLDEVLRGVQVAGGPTADEVRRGVTVRGGLDSWEQRHGVQVAGGPTAEEVRRGVTVRGGLDSWEQRHGVLEPGGPTLSERLRGTDRRGGDPLRRYGAVPARRSTAPSRLSGTPARLSSFPARLSAVSSTYATGHQAQLKSFDLDPFGIAETLDEESGLPLPGVENQPRSAILAPDGTPWSEDAPERRALELSVNEISEELIARLAAEPALLYQLHHRRFEELVAELYERQGFHTVLTPQSGDGGVDVYVVRHDELGSSLSVVQCKHHAARRRIGPNLVRELRGTVETTGASAGVLITTSFFTRGARELEQEEQFRLSLQDYDQLQGLLRLPRIRPTS